MYGLDLFSGIAGLTLALEGYTRTVAYCESDRYAQGVLLSRQAEGRLPVAPIWDDVQTLTKEVLEEAGISRIDLITAGFPCQDISTAGKGLGINKGKRSGLWSEVARLIDELRPGIVFLENVPAITSRGLDRVLADLAEIRYSARWGMFSAAEVGACHRRERWFCLAYPDTRLRQYASGQVLTRWNASNPSSDNVSNSNEIGRQRPAENRELERQGSCLNGKASVPSNSESIRCDQGFRCKRDEEKHAEAGNLLADADASYADGSREPQSEGCVREIRGRTSYSSIEREPWEAESPLCRANDGIQYRSHRIAGLGNAVVPQTARRAFEVLTGLIDLWEGE